MLTSRWSLLIAVGLVCALLWGCRTAGKSGTAVARVNEAVLTTDDLTAEMQTDALPVATAEQKQEWTQKWVETQLLYQEAIRRGLPKDRKIARELQKMEHDYLANALLERELAGNRPIITEASITRYYALHQADYIRREPEFKLSVIVVETDSAAQEVWTQLKKRRGGADFGELARTKSIDDLSARNKGDLGYLTRANISDPKLRDAAFALKKGQVSKPVKTEAGYYIVKTTAIHEAGAVRGLAEVREEIVNSLLEEGRRQKVKQLLDRLTQAATVEVNEKALTMSGTRK